MYTLQSKKQYEKSFKEAEKAQEAFRRADADLQLSRAEVERVSVSYSLKLDLRRFSIRFSITYYRARIYSMF